MRALLLSGSGPPSGYLAHARDAIAALAGGRPVLFVPYALADHDAYTARVADALAATCTAVTAMPADPQEARQAVADASVVFAGGGNTFRLLSAMDRLGLTGPIAARVRAGDLDYIGSSAGSNIAGPTIRTTNDMPIVLPACGLDALGLVPFQVNPHYTSAPPVDTATETRDERIAQFLQDNDATVVGIHEGSWLHVDGPRLTVAGRARVFTRGGVQDLADTRADHLLHATATFDIR